MACEPDAREPASKKSEVAVQRSPDKLAVQQPGSAKTFPQGTAATALSSRPLWLLAHPRPLEEIAGAPCYDGRLSLLAGPERIESGWWDGNDVARDYFVASNPAEALLWIYRERGPRGRWYLHGFFA